MIRNRVSVVLFVALCFVAALAQTAKKPSESGVSRIEKNTPGALVFDNLPAPLYRGVEDSGYSVTLDGKQFAEIWLAKNVAGEGSGNTSAVYPQFAKGAFLGLIVFNSAAKDFRGQPIKPYVYSMRYDLMPSDGNHMGAAPQPDFALLVGVSMDGTPDKAASEADMLSGSRGASGTGHPATFSLVPADSVKDFPSVFKSEEGFDVVAAKINVNGKPVPVAIVLRGQAAQ
jgi:hypothetical protein